MKDRLQGFVLLIQSDRCPAVIRPHGRLTFSECGRLHAAVQGIVSSGCARVIVDFRFVRSMDRSVLAWLEASRYLCEESGGRLALTNLPPDWTDLMSHTRLGRHMLIRDRPETAMVDLSLTAPPPPLDRASA